MVFAGDKGEVQILHQRVERGNGATGHMTVAAGMATEMGRGQTHGIPHMSGWAQWTGPATQPADVGARLVAHGFLPGEEAPGIGLICCL